MNDLVSALRNISTSEEPVEEEATKVSLKVWPFCPCSHVRSYVLQAPASGGVLAAAPVEKKVDEVEEQQPRERSNTMPSIEVEEASDVVVLRVPTGPRQNPDKRKSGSCCHRINVFRLTLLSSCCCVLQLLLK